MKLYLRYLGIQLRSQMQHKTSFFFSMLGQALSSLTVLIGVYFMFERFNAVEGFTYEQALICFAVILLSFSTAECFGRGFDTFSRMLGNGQFDRIMVRPRGVMLQVLATNTDFTRLGRFFEAVVVFVYALPRAGIAWSGAKIAVLASMIICGTFIFIGLFVIYASLCFFTTEGLEFINIFTDGAREFGKYPVGIYGKAVLALFTYLVPIALVQYYPLLYLIDRAPHWWYSLLPETALLFLIPCFALWKVGVRHFRSTGS